MFDVWTSNFEVGVGTSMFDLLGQTSKFEVGVWTSMFDLLGQTEFRSPTSIPPIHPSFPLHPTLRFFFHAKLRSQTSTSQFRHFLLENHFAFAGWSGLFCLCVVFVMDGLVHQMVGGSVLSGVPVHRPRCGHASSSFASLGHWEGWEPKMLWRRRQSKPRWSVPGRRRNRHSRLSKPAGAPTRCKVRRFEEALKAMGDMQGPEVEVLQDALKRARQAAQERPLASQLSECRSFIERSERRLEKIDAERAAETLQLNEARSRLSRLEAQAAVLPPDVPRHTPAADVSVELEELRAKLASTERERDEALSAPACYRQAMSRTAVVLGGTKPPIPDSFVLTDLSAWMDDRHVELFAAIQIGDQVRTQRLTSRWPSAQNCWISWQGPGHLQDREFAVRSARG